MIPIRAHLSLFLRVEYRSKTRRLQRLEDETQAKIDSKLLVVVLRRQLHDLAFLREVGYDDQARRTLRRRGEYRLDQTIDLGRVLQSHHDVCEKHRLITLQQCLTLVHGIGCSDLMGDRVGERLLNVLDSRLASILQPTDHENTVHGWR